VVHKVLQTSGIQAVECRAAAQFQDRPQQETHILPNVAIEPFQWTNERNRYKKKSDAKLSDNDDSPESKSECSTKNAVAPFSIN
jgi:hypothetical protein